VCSTEWQTRKHKTYPNNTAYHLHIPQNATASNPHGKQSVHTAKRFNRSTEINSHRWNLQMLHFIKWF